jgi:biopolymer transport protein ExbB
MSIASANPVLPALLAEGGGTMSLFEYVRAGGSLGYVLIALSVLAVALVVRNLLVLRKSLLAPEDLVTRLSGMLRSGDVAGAARACAEDPAHSFVAGVMQSAIRRCSANPMGAFEARAAVEEAGQVATAKLQRLNNGLGVLAAVGPMLGLLGTVIGMIGAFNAIGSLQGAARSTELARFMSLALVNTENDEHQIATVAEVNASTGRVATPFATFDWSVQWATSLDCATTFAETPTPRWLSLKTRFQS